MTRGIVVDQHDEIGEMPSMRDAAEAIRLGRYSASELLERCIAEIRAHDGELNAFVHLDLDGARAAARAVDDAIAAECPAG